MKVSVIMAAYNCEHTISSAIESIINQTFTDWELIICDDCSKDKTYKKILEYNKNNCKIKILKNEINMRAAATRNKCINEARGEYITIMDDDDYSYPERLQKQVTFLDNNPQYDFVSSGTDIYDGKNIVAKKPPKITSPHNNDFLWGIPFIHPATMFRTDKLKRVCGYRISKETRRAEDYDLFMRMYANGMKGYNLSDCLYRYYFNPDIMSRKRKYRYRIDEAIVRYKGFKALGLLPKGMIYVIKPLIVGLLPDGLLYKIHTKSKE